MHLELKHLCGIVWKTERYSSFNNIFFEQTFSAIHCNDWQTKVQTITYHIGHASGAFLHPVDGSAVKFFQRRLSLGEQLIGEVTVKQNLLPVARQSQHRDARRHLEAKENEIDRNKKVFPVLLLSWKSNMEILQRVKQQQKRQIKQD